MKIEPSKIESQVEYYESQGIGRYLAIKLAVQDSIDEIEADTSC